MTTKDRVPELVRRSLASSSRAAAELAGRRGQPAAPGDLYLCAATREFPLEWLVVARAGRRRPLLLVFPADTNPLLGEADLAVPATAAAGALSLRCRHGVWVREDALEPGLRTGHLPADDARKVLRRHRELRRDHASLPSLLTDDAGADEQDWEETVLAPARSALAAVHGEAPAAWEGPAESLAAAPRRGLLGLAAALVLTIAGTGSWLAWQQVEIRRLERQAQRLRAEPRREPAAAWLRQPLVNVPFAWLQPQEPLRGAASTIERPADAPLLLVILELPESESAGQFSLELTRRAAPGVLWSARGLRRTGLAEVTVALPNELLAPGEYRLRLSPLTAGNPGPAHEYVFGIRPAPSPGAAEHAVRAPQ
jgi:hypothetical protein